MILKVFSTRDMKAEAFLQPFFMPTQGAALRAFDDACQKSDSPFYMHPNDFVLYEIGSYNDSDGVLTALHPVKLMACAADFIQKSVSPVPVKDFVESAVGVNHGS